LWKERPPARSQVGQCGGGGCGDPWLGGIPRAYYLHHSSMCSPSQARQRGRRGRVWRPEAPGGLRGGGGHGAAEFVTGTEGGHRVLRERRWGARTPLESQGVGSQGVPPPSWSVSCFLFPLIPAVTLRHPFSLLLSFLSSWSVFWGSPKPLGSQEPGGQPLGLGPPRRHRGLHHGPRAPDKHPPGGGDWV